MFIEVKDADNNIVTLNINHIVSFELTGNEQYIALYLSDGRKIYIQPMVEGLRKLLQYI